jgi:hypothetical protein
VDGIARAGRKLIVRTADRSLVQVPDCRTEPAPLRTINYATTRLRGDGPLQLR